MPCYFHFSGQNIIKCITFCSKTQKIVINQYFLKYLRQSDCYLFRFSTSQIWTYYSNIIQILSGVSKDGENPLLKLLIRDSYLSALVSLGTVQHCRLFLSLLGGTAEGYQKVGKRMAKGSERSLTSFCYPFVFHFRQFSNPFYVICPSLCHRFNSHLPSF